MDEQQAPRMALAGTVEPDEAGRVLPIALPAYAVAVVTRSA
jgi:hypothetical protein